MPETMTAEIPAKQIWPSNPPNNGKCKTQVCKGDLTWLGDCWRCLTCNPFVKVNKVEKPKRKYIDVTLTEDMVREIISEEIKNLPSSSIGEAMNVEIREIVQDEMANWHIQKPPVTRDEITETTGSHEGPTIFVPKPKPETWLQKAKRLGVQTHIKTGGMRKKVDIMADMERLGEDTNVLAEAKETEESPEGDNTVSPVRVEKGA